MRNVTTGAAVMRNVNTAETLAMEKSDTGQAKRKSMPKSHMQIFPDAASMKKDLKEKIKQDKYDVSMYYWDTGFCQRVVRDAVFERITFGVIAVNAIWISIDADLNKQDAVGREQLEFSVMNHFFCAYFFLEWLMRFGAFRRKLNGLRDAWFCFDGFMAILMVLETWLMPVVMLIVHHGQGGGNSSLGGGSILRLLRLARLTRLLRMVRLLRAMPELLVLVKGVVAALRSVVFTLLLLLVMIYIFSIVFVQVSKGTQLGDTYFRTVPDAMHSLLIDGVLVDGPNAFVSTAIDYSPFGEAAIFIFLYYSFVLLSNLTLMNMLIGVVCEVLSTVAECEHEELTMLYIRDELRKFLDEADQHAICKDKFLEVLEKDGAAAMLQEVEVDIFSLVDLVDTIFTTDDGQERTLDFPDLVEVMLRYRSTKEASFADVTELKRAVTARMNLTEAKSYDTLWNLEATVTALGEVIEKAAKAEPGTVARLAKEELARKSDVGAKAVGVVAPLKDQAMDPSCGTPPPAQKQLGGGGPCIIGRILAHEE